MNDYYYVDDKKLVGNGSNESCILTKFIGSYLRSELSSYLNVGTSDISLANLGPNYKINTNDTLSFYRTNYNTLKCILSSGYTSTDAIGITTDIIQNGLISYRIHNAGTDGSFSTNGANKLNVLLIGGGGGGAGTARSMNHNRYGKGGGGAGGLILFTANDLTSSSNYYIQIGAGGTGGDAAEVGRHSNHGSPSIFSLNSISISANGGVKSNSYQRGVGGNVTTLPTTLPTNYTLMFSQTDVSGIDGQNDGDGNGWGGRGGTYNNSGWGGFPIVIRTHASPSNTLISPFYVAQNNYGYNTQQATNGYGTGGGGAGGSNHGSSHIYQYGANGGNGLGIVFFRYD